MARSACINIEDDVIVCRHAHEAEGNAPIQEGVYSFCLGLKEEMVGFHISQGVAALSLGNAYLSCSSVT